MYIDIDYETRSTRDLKELGLKNYLPHAEITLAAWMPGPGQAPVNQWDAFDPDPAAWDELEFYLREPAVTKRAFNARFEIEVTRNVASIPVDLREWVDVMAWAYARSFSGKLGDVCRQLGLPDDKHKRAAGTRLLTKFCTPPFADPMKHPDDWLLFKDYNRQDVVAEEAVADYLAPFPLSEEELDLWRWDYKVNDTGIPVDVEAVQAALDLVDRETRKLFDQMKVLTGLDNPNSQKQLLQWLQAKGYPYGDITKDSVAKAVLDPFSGYQEVLELRQDIAQAATKKLLPLMRQTLGGRIFHTLQIWGAGRTGRWAGRGLQLQNLKRPTIENPEQIADLLHDGYADLVEFLFT